MFRIKDQLLSLLSGTDSSEWKLKLVTGAGLMLGSRVLGNKSDFSTSR